MTKSITAKIARDVAADLLGSPAKMSKAAAKIAAVKPSKKQRVVPPVAKAQAKAKGKAARNGIGRPSAYADNQRIVIVTKDRAVRKGTQSAKIWGLVVKSKTIADYKKARANAGLNGIGGMFQSLVNAGHVKVQ